MSKLKSECEEVASHIEIKGGNREREQPVPTTKGRNELGMFQEQKWSQCGWRLVG